MMKKEEKKEEFESGPRKKMKGTPSNTLGLDGRPDMTPTGKGLKVWEESSSRG